MNNILIDLAECNSCKTCVKACFVNVFRWDESKKGPIVAYPEDCVQCNACELACPNSCIEVIPDYLNMHWPTV
jgi:NAD-dependent dihydropyrimidine dehydrogenase PreA subunit